MVIANPNIWPSVDQPTLPPAYRHDHLVSQPSAPCCQPPALLGDNKIALSNKHIHPATLLHNAPAPARQAYFVWGTYVDELLLVNDDADYYACRDHLYSVHVLYNPTTGIAERYDYDAYGQPTIYTDDGGDSDWWDGDEDPNNESLINNAYTFTGRRLDTLDSGDLVIIYYRARYYSPNTGRFLSRDPIGYADSMNLYEYVDSRPGILVDPYGLLSWNSIDINWNISGTGCSQTGSASVSIEVSTLPLIDFFADSDTTVEVSGSFAWTGQTQAQCVSSYTPWTWTQSRDFKGWPPSVSVSANGNAPDAQASVSMSMSAYYNWILDAGVTGSASISAQASDREWVPACCDCLKTTLGASLTVEKKTNVTGTAAAVAVVVAAWYGAPALIAAGEGVAAWLAEQAARAAGQAIPGM